MQFPFAYYIPTNFRKQTECQNFKARTWSIVSSTYTACESRKTDELIFFLLEKMQTMSRKSTVMVPRAYAYNDGQQWPHRIMAIIVPCKLSEERRFIYHAHLHVSKACLLMPREANRSHCSVTVRTPLLFCFVKSTPKAKWPQLTAVFALPARLHFRQGLGGVAHFCHICH